LLEVGFARDPRTARHAELGWEPTATERSLLSWCFCASCRQRAAEAGVDVQRVQSLVSDLLTNAMRLEPAGYASLSAMLAEHEPLAAYRAMRDDVEDSLLRMVRTRTTTRLVMHAAAGEPAIADQSPHLDGLVRRWESERAHGGIRRCGRHARSPSAGFAQRPSPRGGGTQGLRGGARARRFLPIRHHARAVPGIGVRQAIRYARRESGR